MRGPNLCVIEGERGMQLWMKTLLVVDSVLTGGKWQDGDVAVPC